MNRRWGPWPRTLAARLFLALCCIGLLPAAAVSVGAVTLQHSTLAAQSSQELTGFARSLAGEMDVYLSSLYATAQSMAALPQVAAARPDEKVLLDLYVHQSEYSLIAVVDRQGRSMASVPADQRADFAGLRSLANAIAGQPDWEIRRTADGRTSLLVTTPIRGIDGNVTGVLCTVSNLANIANRIRQLQPGQEDRAYVVDAAGQVILSPGSPSAPDLAHHDLPLSPVGVGVVRYSAHGQRRMAGYAPVPGTGWLVLVERPENAVLAPAHRVEALALFGLAVTLFLALVLVGVVTVRLTNPVHRLSLAARAFAAGDANAPLPASGRGSSELQTLIDSFGAMRQAAVNREAELLRLTDMLQALANQDPLTGLLNRHRLRCELEQQLTQPHQGAVVFLDLDDFKYVNDSLGHQAGDQVLIGVANLLRREAPPRAHLARLGGDEFAILLPDYGTDAVKASVQRLLETMRAGQFAVEGQFISLQGSAGIAFYPEHGDTVQALLARADLAMYQAKGRGGNAPAVYSSDDSPTLQLEAKLTWERRLRQALAEDGLCLYSQPILHLASQTVTHHELLLRLRDADGTVHLPGQFLATAERFGLIHELDAWVVRNAIRRLAAARQAGQPATLAINLSGRSFANPKLLPLFETEFAATGADPSHLIIEITETAGITHPERAVEFVDTLRRLGCRFALDDFGVGFTSFEQLKSLNVDYLKVDGSFILHLCENAVDQQFVQAVVRVAHGLGKQVVAEWVQDAPTLALLRQYGVEYAQGYYIGRPGPVLS